MAQEAVPIPTAVAVATNAVVITSTEAPLPKFQDVGSDVLPALQVQRLKKLQEFGWKASYGALVPVAEGNARRAKAEALADNWFFAELGRATLIGQRYLAMRQYFDIAKVDMGWKQSYGPLVPTAKGNAKRKEAELKAIKYTADKFGTDALALESWLLKPQ